MLMAALALGICSCDDTIEEAIPQHYDQEAAVTVDDIVLNKTLPEAISLKEIADQGDTINLFKIEEVIREIREATGHLKGLKIAVMGCIVNGPGEMADADYGYVGAARGKISLYRQKECVRMNIPQENAVQELVNLIRQDGKWEEK